MEESLSNHKKRRDFSIRNALVDDRLPAIQHIRKARESLSLTSSDLESFWRMLALENSAVIDAVWKTLEKAGVDKQDGRELHEVIEDLLNTSRRT